MLGKLSHVVVCVVEEGAGQGVGAHPGIILRVLGLFSRASSCINIPFCW